LYLGCGVESSEGFRVSSVGCMDPRSSAVLPNAMLVPGLGLRVDG
jgi:hypothetical protein